MSDWDEKRAAAVGCAVEAGFSRSDAVLLAGLLRPAARLVARAGAWSDVGASKLGGAPDLPSDARWPVGAFGPMTFCGQVATRDALFLDGVEGWHQGGVLLSFFADKDPDGDNADAGCVLALDAAAVTRRDAPRDLPAASRFPESAFDVVPVLTPPMSVDLLQDLDHDLDADDWGAWERLYERLGCGTPEITAGHHQLLGHSWGGDMDPVWMGAQKIATADEDVDEDSPFRLLAQFTTDHDADVEIADAGAIYFVTAVDELAAGRYDRIGVHMDCC